MVSGMSEKPNTEDKSLEKVAKGAGSEDKAQTPAEAKADQGVTESVLPDMGTAAYPQPGEGDTVRFQFAHPVKKSRLDESVRDDSEFAVGDEVEVLADVAEALARNGAGRVVDPA